MNHDPFQWGRPSDSTYGQYNYAISNAKSTATANEFPSMHTQQPIITGTSVIAMKFKGGVVLAADNLGSYGSLARFADIERLFPVGEKAVVGVSGDISDLQYVQRLLEDLETEEQYDYDGHTLRAGAIHEYLQKVFYSRRSKMDPLWNSCIIGGVDKGEVVLKSVDLLGVTYSAPAIATGFGAYLALPIMRKVVFDEKDVENVTEQKARETIDECMRVLYYRDARSLDKYSVVTITDAGVKVEKNVRAEGQSWRFAEGIKGYGTQKV